MNKLKPTPGKNDTRDMKANLDQLKKLMLLRNPVGSRHKKKEDSKPLNLSKAKLEQLKEKREMGKDFIFLASTKFLAKRSLAIEEAETLP